MRTTGRSLALLTFALAVGLAGCTGSGDGEESASALAPTAETTADGAPTAGETSAAPAESWLTEDLAAELQAAAVPMVEALAAGDPAPVMDAATDAVTDVITTDQLQEAWDTTAASFGAYQEIAGTSVTESGPWAVVSVVSTHENGNLKTEISFTEEGAVDGIWFAPATPQDLAAIGLVDPSTSPGEDVTIGELELPGRLILPEGADTVVLFVSGSGPQDMDGTIGGSSMYRDVAVGLADAGIASLRVDDRFYAHPEAGGAAATIQDEMLDDAAAAIDFLASDPRTADMSIVVVGHSLGAMVLPNILADNPEADGGIFAAGSPRSLWDIIYDQNVQAFESADAEALAGQPSLEEIAAEVERANNLTDPNAPPILGGLPAAYVVSLNELNSAEVASTLTVPLLVLQGEMDVQVFPEADFEAWRPVLADVPDVTYELFPGVNHLFMPSTGGGVEEYQQATTVAPEVLDAVVTWIDARY